MTTTTFATGTVVTRAWLQDVNDWTYSGTAQMSQIKGGNGTGALPFYSFASETNSGLYRSSTNVIAMSIAGGSQFLFTSSINSGFAINSDTLPLTLGASQDTRLFRDAADVLALRRGSNAQTLRIYSDYTDSSNNELLVIRKNGTGSAQIFANKNGTGTQRFLEFGTAGTLAWRIDTSQHFVAVTDNTNDIGQSGANRPRDFYLGRNATISGTLAVTGATTLSSTVAGAYVPVEMSGRLTLTSALPVTTSDVTGATTVYFTPYKGNVLQLYDGTNWVTQTFTELSQLTTDNTKSPAAVANNSNYDVFVWLDSGTMRATRGPAWTSDTARGTGAGTTELELFEGRYVNKIAITNGPVARRGLYVGTIRSDGSAQINDSVLKRHVWNNFNRRVRSMLAVDTTDTWGYNTATTRQARATATNQLDVVVGLSEDIIDVILRGGFENDTAGALPFNAIGLDSTTTPISNFLNSKQDAVAVNRSNSTCVVWKGFTGIGRHTLVWLENGGGTGNTTFYGDSGAGANFQTGIAAQVWA